MHKQQTATAEGHSTARWSGNEDVFPFPWDLLWEIQVQLHVQHRFDLSDTLI